MELDEKINLNTHSQFLDDIGAVQFFSTAITFILGAISTGFLKQIGEEIWDNFKKIFLKNNKEKNMPSFKFEFEFNGVDIKAKLVAKDPENFDFTLKNLNNIIQEVLDNEDDQLQKINLEIDCDLEEWKIKDKK